MLFTNEEMLAKALKSGQRDKLAKVFEKIYQDYSRLVSFYLGKYINDSETIKDLTNDVFLNFFNNASKVKENIKAYLCSSAKNTALNYLKSQKHYVELDENLHLSSKDNILGSIFYQDLIKELKNVLTAQEVEIVELHAIDGYSFNEIAERFNISANNANVIYHRAIKKFKKNKER